MDISRQQFLHHLGFSHDPFATPVAEQELARLQQIFYSYYTPCSSSFSGNSDFLSLLRKARHAFIYGEPGQGKSALRLTLDADCRTVLDGTLAVTYTLGADAQHLPGWEEHGTRLAQSLTIDLTLALIEQVNARYNSPSAEQIHNLKALLPAGGRPLKRFLETLAEALKPDAGLHPTWGVGHYGSVLGKAPVKYVGRSPDLAKLLATLNEINFLQTSAQSGWDTFYQGVRVAQGWGLKRIFILLDGVDTQARSLEEMFALIKPLLTNLKNFEGEQVFLKFFVPTELQEKITQTSGRLYPASDFAILIKWDVSSLRQLLKQRLYAAALPERTPYPGLNSLAQPGFDLEKKALELAKNSPRRLLQIVSALIDAHLINHSETFFFTAKDWETCLQRLNPG